MYIENETNINYSLSLYEEVFLSLYIKGICEVEMQAKGEEQHRQYMRE